MTGLENANQRADELAGLSPSAIKQCCAAVYDSDVARLLLGDSLHPGGTKLTEHLGQILVLGPKCACWTLLLGGERVRSRLLSASDVRWSASTIASAASRRQNGRRATEA